MLVEVAGNCRENLKLFVEFETLNLTFFLIFFSNILFNFKINFVYLIIHSLEYWKFQISMFNYFVFYL